MKFLSSFRKDKTHKFYVLCSVLIFAFLYVSKLAYSDPSAANYPTGHLATPPSSITAYISAPIGSYDGQYDTAGLVVGFDSCGYGALGGYLSVSAVPNYTDGTMEFILTCNSINDSAFGNDGTYTVNANISAYNTDTTSYNLLSDSFDFTMDRTSPEVVSAEITGDSNSSLLTIHYNENLSGVNIPQYNYFSFSTGGPGIVSINGSDVTISNEAPVCSDASFSFSYSPGTSDVPFNITDLANNIASSLMNYGVTNNSTYICTGCGNGTTDPGESCDDGGNNGSGGYCNSTCTGMTEYCGDSICNNGEDNGSCPTDCASSGYCGDGSMDPGESCDDGGYNGTNGHCNSSCTGMVEYCGDGMISGGEICDDAENNGANGYCNSSCTGAVEYCGDNSCNNGEDSNSCPSDCGASDTTPPNFVSGSIDGSNVVLSYDDTLFGSCAEADFHLFDGVTMEDLASASTCAIDGVDPHKLDLTFGSGVLNREQYSISFTRNTTTLADGANNPIVNLANQPLTNDTHLAVTSIYTDNASMHVVFNRDLDYNPTPDITSFSIVKNGVAQASCPSSSMYSGHELLFDVNNCLISGTDSVSLSYNPGIPWIRDLNSYYLPNFSSLSVQNNSEADFNSPTITIVSPTTGTHANYNTFSPNINWDDSVTCSYSYDDVSYVTLSSCDASLIESPSSDRAWTLYVHGIDASNNTGSASVSFYYDANAPEAPTGLIMSSDTDSGLSDADGFTMNSSPHIMAFCETGATVYLKSGGSVIGSGECIDGSASISLNALADGEYRVAAYQVDAAGNDSPFSGDYTFKVDNVRPDISDISVTPHTTTAQVYWSTAEENTNAQIAYGPTSNYAATTTSTDNFGAQSHNITLTDLISCSIYHYRVVSSDLAGNVNYSDDSVFVTSGCTGSASMITYSTSAVVSGIGGSLSIGALAVSVPSGFSAGTDAVFQAKKINQPSFSGVAGVPSGQTLVGTNVYNLKALVGVDNILSTFLSPITITMSYSPDDVVGLDESTLKIYRYDGAGWAELSNCVVDTNSHTVTCSTLNFSDFAIFGSNTSTPPSDNGDGGNGGGSPEDNSGGNSGGSSGGGSGSNSGNRSGGVVNVIPTQAPSDSSSQNIFLFTKQIAFGVRDSVDAKELQRFLNSHGFVVAESGPGSVGFETSAFGQATKVALIKFQKSIGIKTSLGVFGPITRGAINKILLSKNPIKENLKQDSCPRFTLPEKMGYVGGDILEIRNFLNNSEGEQLNASITLFDKNLFDAVSRFQAKYKSDVLSPIGLKTPTGLWLDLTRKKANSLVGCK